MLDKHTMEDGHRLNGHQLLRFQLLLPRWGPTTQQPQTGIGSGWTSILPQPEGPWKTKRRGRVEIRTIYARQGDWTLRGTDAQ